MVQAFCHCQVETGALKGIQVVHMSPLHSRVCLGALLSVLTFQLQELQHMLPSGGETADWPLNWLHTWQHCWETCMVHAELSCCGLVDWHMFLCAQDELNIVRCRLCRPLRLCRWNCRLVGCWHTA